jgi:F-type H+-transporting ATPase subunit gamma
MAGAGLIAIKRRINSVSNTRKITKAMGLVATAKLRKNREKLLFNEKFYASTIEVMKNLLDNLEEKSIYTHGNKSKKKLYIVMTSESGLCGAFNGNVINETLEKIKEEKNESLIMVVGQKGKNTFNRLKYQTAAEYVDVPDVPTGKEASIIANHALSLFKSNEVGEIYIVYTMFTSAVKMTVLTDKLLPVPFYSGHNASSSTKFEPKIENMLDDYVNLYMKECIMYNLLNSKASEHATRMNSMDSSTKNANDLIDKLKLKYNRIRQGAITQEISEIVGGAEAQK